MRATLKRFEWRQKAGIAEREDHKRISVANTTLVSVRRGTFQSALPGAILHRCLAGYLSLLCAIVRSLCAKLCTKLVHQI